MYDIFENIFSFLALLFLALVHFWYVFIPITALAIWAYFKSKSETVRRAIRIYFAIIILSTICAGIYMALS